MRFNLFSLSLFFACGPLLRAQDFAADVPATEARLVAYGERDVIPIKAKVRFTTLIVLPKHEVILDFTCGDKEFWIVNGTANFAYVKPAKPKAETNLNLITGSGNVYSFVLREISETADAEPDLKVFVEPKEQSAIATIDGQPRFVPFSQIDDYRQQAEIARTQAREAAEQARTLVESEMSRIRSEYPAKLQHSYRYPPADKLFRVSAMYHDGKFTYIRANPQETPALYEIKDGKPNLVQFDFKDGVYTVAKVLDNGYLAIGKKKLGFARSE